MVQPHCDVVPVTRQNVWPVRDLDIENEIRREHVSRSLGKFNQFASRNTRGGEIDVMHALFSLEIDERNVPDVILFVKAEACNVEDAFDSTKLDRVRRRSRIEVRNV